MTNLSDREVIWITGASSGIGRALALEWAKRATKSTHFILSARRLGELDQVGSEIRRMNDRCTAGSVALDLEHPANFPQIADDVIRRNLHVDVLVNNAGLSQRSLAKDTEMRVYERLLKVNALGTIALTQALLPYFLARKSGQVVTISSVAGKFGTPYRSGYCAAKHALHGYVDAVRAETVKENLIFTTLCPGFVRTDVSRNALTGSGAPNGEVDGTLADAMSAEEFAEKAYVAIRAREREKVIAGPKESFGAFMSRYFPEIFARMIPNAVVR